MSGTVILCVLAAALAHAVWNALLKGREGGASDPRVTMTGLSAVWAIGFACAVPFISVSAVAWPWLAATIAIHLVYVMLLVRVYRVGEMSLVYPIIRGLPPVIVFGVLWLAGEPDAEPVQLVGVVTISAGILVIGAASMTSQAGAKTQGLKRAIPLALATAACIAAYLSVDAIGVRLSGSALGYWVLMTAGQGAIFALGSLLHGGVPLAHKVWDARWKVLLAGVLSSGGYGVALWAFTQAPPASVAALRETSVLFGSLIAVGFLGERLAVGASSELFSCVQVRSR